jgi:threonine/homoserine/homoserine lactone efflux protein
MEVLLTFALAFFFSFIGTIPPGTMNLAMVQLGLDHRMSIAWRFALAAAIIEYPYAWLAIKFENLITTSPVVTENIQLLTGVVMIILGGFSLWSAQKPSTFSEKFNNSGFRRGIILSILNPLALPFWIGVTAYLRSLKWIDLSSELEIHAYLFGVSLGSLCLLITLAYLAKKVISHFQQNSILKKIPGFTLLILGVYALAKYLL